MPSEASERRASRAQQMGVTIPQVDHDPLPCPRCESTNTKFCYYNNYNFSQPRHFCKACRRYWTHGGTLRDIPIGGGSRKTAKRSRTSSSPVVSIVGPQAHAQPLLDPLPASPVFVSLPCSVPTVPTPVTAGAPVSAAGGASFTSLLSTAGPGILALGGFGLGLDDVGFGLGRGVWAFPEVGYGNGGINAGGGVASGVGGGGGGGGGGADGTVNRGDMWQGESTGESGFGVSGDCFSSLPELAISTPGNGLK